MPLQLSLSVGLSLSLSCSFTGPFGGRYLASAAHSALGAISEVGDLSYMLADVA